MHRIRVLNINLTRVLTAITLNAMSVPEVGKDAPKVLIIGVGGATNSGKTTLAKYILSLFPAQRCLMLHQDDFALPESELPWNDTLQARDWDHPIGTVRMKRIALIYLLTMILAD